MFKSSTETPHNDADGQVWTMISDAIQRLEASWATGSAVSLASLLPDTGHDVRRRVLLELIKVDQEYRWKSGDRKRTEAYLDEWPKLGSDREAVLELLEAECLTRAVVGELPEAAELGERFPGIAGQIDLQEAQLRAVAEATSETSGALPSDGLSPASQAVRPEDHASPAPPLEIGQSLGRYEIATLLGEGGMGGFTALTTRAEATWP